MDRKLVFMEKKGDFLAVNGLELDVLEKYGKQALVNDFSTLTGCSCGINRHNSFKYTFRYDDSSFGKYALGTFNVGEHYDKTYLYIHYIDCILNKHDKNVFSYNSSECKDLGIRPAMVYSDNIPTNGSKPTIENDVIVAEYGYYPRSAASKNMQSKLERLYKRNKLIKSGDNYTIYNNGFYCYFNNSCLSYFCSFDEYEYEGKKYVRLCTFLDDCIKEATVSNGETYRNGDFVWIEVEPVKWLVDEKTKTMITKEIIVSGLPVSYQESFSAKGIEDFLIYKFTSETLSKEMFRNVSEVYYSSKDKLVAKIRSYLEKLDYKNKIMYQCELDSILREYEEDLEKLRPLPESDTLQLDTETTTGVYTKLLSKLEMLYYKMTKTDSRIDTIRENINSLINHEDIQSVENNPHSFEISYYLGIQSWIEEIINYVSTLELISLDDNTKNDISNMLDKKISECMNILDSDISSQEKFTLIGVKVLEYKKYVDDLLRFQKEIHR